MSVTMKSPHPRIECALSSAMQSIASKVPPESETRTRCARSRRKVVTQVLRAAYRRHVRDRFTRIAVKQALGSV